MNWQSEKSEKCKFIAYSLFSSEMVVDTHPNRDIACNACDSDEDAPPTVSGCGQYPAMLWTTYKTGNAWIYYTIQARSESKSSNRWVTIALGEIRHHANSWFTLVLTGKNGLYWDEYRIRVRVRSKQGMQKIITGVYGVIEKDQEEKA